MNITHVTLRLFHTLIVCLALISCGRKKAEGPVILNASETARAGDVVYLQGSAFGQSPRVQFLRNSLWVALPPLSVGPDIVTAQIPLDTKPEVDLFAMRVSGDGKVWSNPVLINEPVVMHFASAEVVPQGEVRVFGRNLYLSRRPSARFVDTHGGASFPATVVATPASYELLLRAPPDLVPGHSYAIYLSNGFTNKSNSDGEAKSQTTLLCKPSGRDYWQIGVPWAPSLDFYQNVYNVRTDSRLKAHALGDGVSNDLPAIQEAISAATKAGGGVVFLPAATYKVEFPSGCGIGLMPRVVLSGAGASKTIIKYGYGPAPQSGGYAVCFASEESGVTDVTFTNVNESGHWPQSALGVNCKKLFIQRTGWDIGTSQWITLTQTDDLAIENTTITQGVDSQFNYNGPLELSGSSHFLIKGNSITYAVGGIDFGRMNDGVFEDNTIMRDASVHVPSSAVTHVISANFTSNFAVLRNQFITTGTLQEQNDGETILSEGGGPERPKEARGTVSSSKGLKVIDENSALSSEIMNPTFTARPVVAIVSGPANGQWRNLTGISDEGREMLLDKPWTVDPSPGSHYAIVNWSAANWIIAANTMSNNTKGIEFFNASAHDVLVENNTMTDNSGIMISPDQRLQGEFNVVYHVEIRDNLIVDSMRLRPAYVALVPREDSQTSAFGTALLGLSIRGNKLVAASPNTFVRHSDDEKAVVEGFNCYWQWQTTTKKLTDSDVPVLLGTIFQGNTVTNSRVAFYLNSGSSDTTIDGTRTNNVDTLLRDDVIPGATHASLRTVVRDTSAEQPRVAELTGAN
jgi:hypothetical protein